MVIMMIVPLGLSVALACGAGRRAASPPAAPQCWSDTECASPRVCDLGACVPWYRMRGETAEISARALYNMLYETGNPPQVLDVRTGAEWRLDRIEGAVHVPIQRLARELDELPLDKRRPVVAICLTAHRSIAAVRLLSRHGYDVVQLQGGMRAWNRDALPTVSGPPTTRERRRNATRARP